MATSQLTLSQIMGSNTPAFNEQLTKVLTAIDNGNLSPAEFNAKYGELYGFKIKPEYTKLGSPNGYSYYRVAQNSTTNPINSNVTTVNRGTLRTPINTTVDPVTNTVKSGRILPPSGAPSTYAYVANSIASPIVAVGTGIALGKAIDSTLYNANPKFWDSVGMSSLNPETWNSITSGVDYSDPVTGGAASLMNVIFGLNPETNEITPYIDEDAFAYMARYLYNSGAFSASDEYVIDEYDFLPHLYAGDWSLPVYAAPIEAFIITRPSGYPREYTFTSSGGNVMAFFTRESESSTWGMYAVSLNAGTSYYRNGAKLRDLDHTVTINGNTFYYAYVVAYGTDYSYNIQPVYNAPYDEAGYVVLFGTHAGNIEGISDQPNAQLPDTSTWGDPTQILPSLRQQYPNIFDNPVQQTTVNPDGTVTTRNYVPIPLPDTFTNNMTQPVSGNQTQTDTTVSVDTMPETMYDSFQKAIQQPDTEPYNPDYNPPENPTDTGEGSTPQIVIPSGSASALWSIYHPTQAQVDAFGGWLWSSDFVDQLLKVFNNPMESIIGLHKIYATPTDAGQTTIAVGYLNSNVPSAYITQQYVTVNCGQVSLAEYFGNVFDYSPFTDVKLYLPFVGIVPLNVNDVMRSTITIKYGVDMFTGACLAMVEVTRDGNTVIEYQYAGNCAVQYPISSGSYMGIVSSILGVAGSVVATVATGGGAAPLAFGAAASAMNAHTSVQNSGSFSGNAGAMGNKKPYLIISRPQTKLANNFQSYEGQPTNHTVTIGSCQGFIKCRDVHLTNVYATDTELDEIQNLLFSGILI